MALVYLHTNKITKQKYVGITNYDDAVKRWREGKGYETQYFGKAGLGVYGWDGFEHEVLVNGISPQLAATVECLLIKQMESANPRYGYNTSEGKIFPECYAEAQELLNNILISNPFILTRIGITEDQIIRQNKVILDPVQIKTVKAGTTISNYSLGAIADYFDYVYYCCLINEKSNTSFLICTQSSFAFIDKGEIIVYPFKDSLITYQLDKYNHREEKYQYKSIEVIDNNKIKPTIIITGTIANMKDFPYKLYTRYETYLEEQIAEIKRLKDLEDAKIARIAERRKYKALAAAEAEKERMRAERKAKRKAWFKKLFDFSQ